MKEYLHVQKLGRNLRFLLTKLFVDLTDQMRDSTSFHDFYYLITASVFDTKYKAKNWNQPPKEEIFRRNLRKLKLSVQILALNCQKLNLL
jgi:hypothetical protein